MSWYRNREEGLPTARNDGMWGDHHSQINAQSCYFRDVHHPLYRHGHQHQHLYQHLYQHPLTRTFSREELLRPPTGFTFDLSRSEPLVQSRTVLHLTRAVRPHGFGEAQVSRSNQRLHNPVPSSGPMQRYWSVGDLFRSVRDQHHSVNQRFSEGGYSRTASCVAMNSDRSMGRYLTFKDQQPSVNQRFSHGGYSPTASRVSMYNDRSMGRFLTFKDQQPSVNQRWGFQAKEVLHRSVSSRTNKTWSFIRNSAYAQKAYTTCKQFLGFIKNKPDGRMCSDPAECTTSGDLDPKEQQDETKENMFSEGGYSPTTSCVSMKSDESMGRFLTFEDQQPSVDQSSADPAECTTSGDLDPKEQQDETKENM